MYRRAGVLKLGAVFALLVYLQALVLPQMVQAQEVECPFDKANPTIDNARYNACWKKVMPQRSYGPGAIVSVDRCYRGMTW